MTTPLGCGFSAYSFCGNYADDNGVAYEICTDFFLAMEEPTLEPLSIHPNPNMGAFVINGGDEITSFTIHDVNGRVVHNGLASGPTSTVQAEHLAPGVYYLRCGARAGRFVVE